MAKLVPQNHPALHTIAEQITQEEIENGFVAKLIKDMKEALKKYSVDGFTAVAIAAPQIGVSKRLFIIEDQSDDRDSLPSLVAINPKIVKVSKKEPHRRRRMPLHSRPVWRSSPPYQCHIQSA